jgi:hypothetical protein
MTSRASNVDLAAWWWEWSRRHGVHEVEVEWTLEIEPEVHLWLDSLPPRQYVLVEQKVDRLTSAPTTLREPYSRHLRGKVRELRFDLAGNARRITYWLAPGRRIVLLTVFRKTRMREAGEVERAVEVQAECEANHLPAGDHDVYSRDVTKELS